MERPSPIPRADLPRAAEQIMFSVMAFHHTSHPATPGSSMDLPYLKKNRKHCNHRTFLTEAMMHHCNKDYHHSPALIWRMEAVLAGLMSQRTVLHTRSARAVGEWLKDRNPFDFWYNISCLSAIQTGLFPSSKMPLFSRCH